MERLAAQAPAVAPQVLGRRAQQLPIDTGSKHDDGLSQQQQQEEEEEAPTGTGIHRHGAKTGLWLVLVPVQ